MNTYVTGNPAEVAQNVHEPLRDKLGSINSTLTDVEVFADKIAEILYGEPAHENGELSEGPHTMEEALDDIRRRIEDLARDLSKIKYMIGG